MVSNDIGKPLFFSVGWRDNAPALGNAFIDAKASKSSFKIGLEQAIKAVL